MAPDSLLRVLWVLLTRFVVPALVVGAIVVAVKLAPFLETRYVAEGKFERRYDPAMQQIGGTQATQIMNSIRSVMVEEITGRPAVEQLIEDLELTRGLPRTAPTPSSPAGELTLEGQLARQDLANRIRASLRVYFQVQTSDRDQVVIYYNSSDRALAPKLVNQAVGNYIRKVRSDLDAALVQSKDFYEKLMKIYRDKAAELEQKKMEFEAANLDVVTETASGMRVRLANLRQQVTALPTQPAGTDASLDHRKRELEAQIDRAEAASRRFPLIQAEYARITREFDDATQQADFYSAKLNETKTAMSMEVLGRGVRLSILQRATALPAAEPDLIPILQLAGIIGGAAGLLVLLTQGIVNLGLRGAAAPTGFSNREAERPAPESAPAATDADARAVGARRPYRAVDVGLLLTLLVALLVGGLAGGFYAGSRRAHGDHSADPQRPPRLPLPSHEVDPGLPQ